MDQEDGVEARTVPLEGHVERSGEEMASRSSAFCEEMSRRRSVREFSDRPVPRKVIENCLRTAGSAPSGANRQPWHFVVVSDPATKRAIRQQAEAGEKAFYSGASTEKWRAAVAHLGTDDRKPFLETAPWLIVVFAQRYLEAGETGRTPNYYVSESVGIATGMLLAAVHQAGLCALTYTPSDMGFVRKLLGTLANERPYLILVVGHPAVDARVPDLQRKALDEIATFV